jgi:hypothetical protein
MLLKYGQNLNVPNSSIGSRPTRMQVMSYLAPVVAERCVGHAKAKFDNLPAEFLAQLKREVENG